MQLPSPPHAGVGDPSRSESYLPILTSFPNVYPQLVPGTRGVEKSMGVTGIRHHAPVLHYDLPPTLNCDCCGLCVTGRRPAQRNRDP